MIKSNAAGAVCTMNNELLVTGLSSAKVIGNCNQGKLIFSFRISIALLPPKKTSNEPRVKTGELFSH